MNLVILKDSILYYKEFSSIPEIFLGFSALQLAFYYILSIACSRKSDVFKLNYSFFCIISLILLSTLTLTLNDDLLNFLFDIDYKNNDPFTNDLLLGVFYKTIVCIFSLIFLVIVNGLIIKDKPIDNDLDGVILIIILFFVSSMLHSSNDLLISYLSIEIQAIALYIIATFKNKSAYSIEIFSKNFIKGSAAMLFLLFGSFLIYSCLGWFNF